jgi:hypothetical protein
MTAAEARYIADNKEREWQKNNYDEVMQRISAQALKGLYFLALTKDVTVSTLDRLQALGFTIEQQQGWVRISW